MILTVAYDLHQPGRDYPGVRELLESASSGYFHIQGSVWLLDTLKPPRWWRDKLKTRGDANDEYFVARIKPHEWASFNAGGAGQWLKDSRRRW